MTDDLDTFRTSLFERLSWIGLRILTTLSVIVLLVVVLAFLIHTFYKASIFFGETFK